jgi:glycosyltransferase involved in cell wall biosynthesis
MAENKIAACIIVGDQYDENEIKTLFESLQDHVHGIFVAYNGTNDDRKGSLGFQNFSPSVTVYQWNFEWEDDFAKARNQSFEMVPKDQFDWYLWLDTDDRLVVDEPLDELIESLDPYTMGVFLKYDYAVHPDTGLVIVEQWRERLLSTKITWNWEFAVHEVCKAPAGTQFAKRDGVKIEHLRKSGEERGARERNRRILANALARYPNEPRYIYYFGAETLAQADAEEDPEVKTNLINAAISAYTKYKQMTNDVNDDYYFAQTRIADLFYMKEDYVSALDAYLECIAIYPTWPDAYVGASKCCMETDQWARMKGFADMATKCSKPTTAAGIEPMMTDFYPYFLRAIAEYELGEYEQSIKDLRKAKKTWNPPDGRIDEKIKEMKRAIKHAEEHENEPDQRKMLRGTKPEKSICFFTSPLPFAWHPKLESGAGAERCIMQLAPRFAADGWRTVVFGTPGEHRGVDENGVEWWDADEYNPIEPFRVFVSSRTPEPFANTINSQAKFLWMHDVNIGPSLEFIKDKPDRILGLTHWHVRHLIDLYDLSGEKMAVIPNGIETSRFEKDRSNDPSGDAKFVWSSSPDRGLDILISMWPQIKEKYPEATLDVFYGWEIIDKIIASHRSQGQVSWLETFKKSIADHLAYLGPDSGITWRGRVDQDTLAEALYKANYWGYPTAFMETSCITALECMAAGVIPITSDLAALGEILSDSPFLVKGWPLNHSYQVSWLKKLDIAVSNEEKRIQQRSINREFALKQTWDNSYIKWRKLIETCGVKV